MTEQTTGTTRTADPPAGAVTAEPFVVPASFAQERVWFASQLARHAPVYHVRDRFPLPFDLPARSIVDALATVVARHEAMRTSFRLDDGELKQVVHPPAGPAAEQVEVVDLTGLPPADREPRIAELAERLVAAPFRLDTAPLWRAMLVRRGDADWHLLFVAHHTIVDAASEVVLAEELTELAAAAAAGRPPALPELPIQYADFAVWQRDRLSGPAMQALVDHWRPVLAGLPAVHSLPTDRPRPAERSFDGDGVLRKLPAGLPDALATACQRLGATPFMLLCAGYLALLNRLSGEPDLAVGVPVAGRDLPELQPLVGMFVNMVVLRVDTGGDPTFEQLVERVRLATLAMLDHQEMPYQKLVELLASRQDPAVPPLYQLGFNYLPQIPGFAGGATTTETDLMLEVTQSDIHLEYSTALFDPGTAGAIADTYLAVLTTTLTNPGVRLSALPVHARAAGPNQVSAGSPAEAEPPQRVPGTVPPRTAAEELVAQVWSELLGVERVGAHDDFFALGGHSLLALRVIARLSAAAEVDLPIHAFFADTTVAGVAAALEQQLAAEIDELTDEEAEQHLAAQDGRHG